MRNWILFFAAALAQASPFMQLPNVGAAPSARVDGTIVYDPVGQQILLFGGGSPARADLWAYSLERKEWRELQPGGAKPAARFGHTAVFDAQRRRLVVFGGQAAGFFNDAWAYDIGRDTWTRLSPEGALPNERYGHSAIYDAARDRMVISHGFTDDGRFDDTWALEFGTNRWRNLSPASNRPLKRCLHHAVYDPVGSQMLLFGGCASGFGPCPLDDLWAFDLNTNRWTQKQARPSPFARQHYGTAFDTARERMVVFGGAGNGLMNDTWEYNPRSDSWAQLTIQNPPSPRNRVEAAYAAERGEIYFFGGSTNAGNSNELWALSTGSAPPRAAPRFSRESIVNAFSGATGAVAPGEIVSIFGENLGPIEGLALAFEPGTGKLPKSAADVSVRWNGIEAPLYYVRQDQLNAQVPYELAGAGEARLAIAVDGLASPEVVVGIRDTRPGLFPTVWNQDGTVNSRQNPAAPGAVIVLYATGQGLTSPLSATGAAAVAPYAGPVAPVRLEIGGMEAEILFQGLAPGTAGVMQVNARVPGVAGPSEVRLTIGAASSQAGVRVEIR